MLDDLLYHSDGFRVVDLLRGRASAQQGIKAIYTNGERCHTTTFSNPNDQDSSSIALFCSHPQTTVTPFKDMSLTRSLFNEFGPMFRMLADEPFSRPLAVASRNDPFDPFFGSNLFGQLSQRSPAVDLTEEHGQYVLSAEVPGVKKENLEVHVGDNGRSITIQGQTLTKSTPNAQIAEAATTSTDGVHNPNEASTSASGQVASRPLEEGETRSTVSAVDAATPNQDRWVSRSSFSRTVWLPHAADATKVSGKLEDGVLRLQIPKLEGHEMMKVNVE
ncbi:hypothetical protein FRB94_001396 [Tulasnella sp. JGI-2019a]|nr:hypothetical protein FRB93_013519 [Tulasnella sp. JGI-2019a]KAG9005612.1 hypothetical protein FRB94_001396 [Tulasnella sp. JGI-2019a]KAG9034474.1 hypothetical protein FRB95_013150 [Tulasnella sp. JGI-2019a]